MADTNLAPDGVTSLYRRFRPGRFAEMRGQEHIVRALQGAVANNRVVHAYLFSGPRGTGKTTTARILAKALNCENPIDDDACNRCASCVAITRGTSLDVVELDAASNNGVDDIREITAGAWHGTPGRWKVYIFDEVHMLSKAAESAFLKTLEEPPPHVVFVLATTDPHKVVATIRSRTQHLEFRLLSADTLNGLLHEVRDAAGLSLDEETLAAAVRMGRGSARDALSALDQVVATGSLADSTPPFDDLLSALAAGDAVASLGAYAELSRGGWDPEQLAETLAGELRQIFLLLVAPEVSDALDVDRDRLITWGEQLGLPRTVRMLETVGRTLREMKSSPVPSILLEVALVRLTRPELDNEVNALDERLTRLERTVSHSATVAPSAPAPTPRPIGTVTRVTPPAPERPEQNSAEPASTVSSARTAAPIASTVAADVPLIEERVEDRDGEPTNQSGVLSFEEFLPRFNSHVLPRLSRSAQIFIATCELRSLAGTVLTIAVPSEGMRASSEKIQSGFRSALEHEFKSSFQVSWIVDLSMERGPTTAPSTSADEPTFAEPDLMDDRDIADSDVLEADSVASLLITEAFPGAEEIR